MLSGGWDSLGEAPASVQSWHDQWRGCDQKVWKEQQEEKLGEQSVVTGGWGTVPSLDTCGQHGPQVPQYFPVSGLTSYK